MKRIHLVYPSGPSIGCPQAIGRHLAQGLAKRYKVIPYAWDDPRLIVPGSGDVLLGHAHPSPWTVFQRSSRLPGWRKVIMMSPFNGDPQQSAWLDPLVERSDLYLGITGPYWAEFFKTSRYARWAPRFRALDLAVDRREFPRIKRTFAPAGKRRFLFIGHSGWPKNTAYLSRLARARPQWDFAWMGGGKESVPGVRALGRFDFSQPQAQATVAGFDFMLTVGTADANPSTILEAMAWGLVPVCTPQSGYDDERGIPNVPLADEGAALEVLDRLQNWPEARLRGLVRSNDARLKAHFHWGRFCGDVIKAIEAPATAPLEPHDGLSWAQMRWQAWRGPNKPWRPRWALKAIRDRWRTW